jgi:Zn finger protein HypA/HybF involved in hydrogenase expression
MAVALQGAVIVEKKNLQITYIKKCGKCDYIGNSKISMSVSSSSSSKYVSSFICPKCKKSQKFEIIGGL